MVFLVEFYSFKHNHFAAGLSTCVYLPVSFLLALYIPLMTWEVHPLTFIW